MKCFALLLVSLTLGFVQVYAAELFHEAALTGTDGALIKAGGVKTDSSMITKKKYFFIYFSAHWCPPCRAFTPKLVEFYKKNAANGDFELLFVSRDKDQAAMDAYMTEMKMPWIGLSLENKQGAALSEKYGVSTIPFLVLLDEKDNVLESSYNDEKYMGHQAPLEKYESLHKK